MGETSTASIRVNLHAYESDDESGKLFMTQ